MLIDIQTLIKNKLKIPRIGDRCWIILHMFTPLTAELVIKNETLVHRLLKTVFTIVIPKIRIPKISILGSGPNPRDFCFEIEIRKKSTLR